MNEELRNQFRPVARAVYLVAFLLVAGPLMDLAAGIWPLSPSSVAWRFAATGLLSRALLVPTLGSLAAMLAALVLDHRRLQIHSYTRVVLREERHIPPRAAPEVDQACCFRGMAFDQAPACGGGSTVCLDQVVQRRVPVEEIRRFHTCRFESGMVT